MKICHVVPIYTPGTLFGSSKYIQDISKGLAIRGHHVTVLTANAITGRGWVDPLFGKYSPRKEEISDDVRVKRMRTKWGVTLSMYGLSRAGFLFPDSIRNVVSILSVGPFLPGLEEEFEKEGYEAIHVTPAPFALVYLVWKACKAMGKPFVCSPFVHFEDPRFINPLLWRIIGDAVAIVACSYHEKERMEEMGIDPSKVVVLPMAIYPHEWKHAGGEVFRRKYGLEGKKVILFAGTKSYNKGAIHVLEAVSRIRQSLENVVLVTLGLSTKEWTRRKESDSGVNLLDLGYVSEEEKKGAFDACDLFVMPSRYDSFGIVYLEAWNCSKPVIGARVGAIPEVIEDGKDGLLVEFGDVEHLSSAIMHLLTDPALRRQMGERGREKVLERFNWQANIEKIEKVYQEVRGDADRMD